MCDTKDKDDGVIEFSDYSVPILTVKNKKKIKYADQLPTPNFRLGIFGCSGSGKTWSIISILKKFYPGIFHEVHIFSPTADLTETNPWYLLNLPEDRMNYSYDEEKLNHLIEEQKQNQLMGEDKRVLIILDDLADVLHSKRGNMVANLITKIRHYCSIILISQKCKLLPHAIRVNLNHLFIFPTKDQMEKKALSELVDCKDFDEIFNTATKRYPEDKINSFLNINKDKNKFYRNLEEEIYEDDDE